MGRFPLRAIRSHSRQFSAALALISMLAVQGCSHTEPGVEIREVRVGVPVPVDCIEANQIPAPVPPVGELPGNAVQAADVLAATVLALRATDRELRALITGCVKARSPS